MIVRLRAHLALDTRDKLGEGPVWDSAAGRLLWLDHEQGIIHEARLLRDDAWKETQRWRLDRPIAAAIPRASGGLIVASATEILLFDDGRVTPFCRINDDPRLIRFNDAKCDPAGRLWAGTLATDFSPSAALYRIDGSGTVTKMLQHATLANGIAWSPDGSTFYFVDSLSLTIDAFDFDLASGTIDRRRTLITLERGGGGANGITVDREGGLWVALTGGGEVRGYSPDGELTTRVGISTAGATSCTFGGEDGATLFITSRSGRMPEIAQAALGIGPEMMNNDGPEAGGLFICRPGQTGAPATPFAG
jgi:sugar lactone lactonase YvrE